MCLIVVSLPPAIMYREAPIFEKPISLVGTGLIALRKRKDQGKHLPCHILSIGLNEMSKALSSFYWCYTCVYMYVIPPL